MRDVAEKEKSFTEEHLKMGRASLAHYQQLLEGIQRERVALMPDATDEALAALDARFERERRQFAGGLPIYAHKPELVRAMKANNVLLVTAPTGSGKSTQLPQYMLDEVLDPRDKRKVAVLQPRRVNASSLCERVAEERGSRPGGEVGYTVGRGLSNATDETRLHFMTHGLFVQLAQNMEAFAKAYAAVLLDEAHERSVEIDMSFALLRQMLSAKLDVRLVIMSATIGGGAAASGTSTSDKSVASRFQDFLADPSGPQAPLLHLHGSAFPVFVRRCPMPDTPELQAGSMAKAIGAAGNSMVLASLAIQHAIDVLRTTKEGNILVFVAGEADVSRAIRTVRNYVASPTLGAAGAGGGGARGTTTTSTDYGSFYGSYGSFLGASSALGFSFLLPEVKEEGAEASSSSSSSSSWVGSVGAAIGSAFGIGGGLAAPASSQQVGVYPFHGKLSPTERDQVLNHHEDRLVIFTTNYAETGLTIPNVRYVIDTGLERRARWNPELRMEELTTQPITRSSMLQRTGRAGRVASGICVRLYTEEAEKAFEELPPPSILEHDSENVVLQLLEMRKRCGNELKLIDDIPKAKWQASARQLIELGAVDKVSGQPTSSGTALLRLGLEHRLGRFLITAKDSGCLGEAMMLVAVLASNGGEKLLPARPAKDVAQATGTGGGGGSATSKLKDFEVSMTRYRWDPVTDDKVRTVLMSVLAAKGPGQYEINGKRYEARLKSPGAIVQRNLESGYERNVREVATAKNFTVGLDDLHARFLDETGDHWTLLRIMQAYRSESPSEGELNWCQRNGFAFHVLSEADTTYQHIQDQCAALRMLAQVKESDWLARGGEPSAELKANVLKALCTAFYDQLCSAKDAAEPGAGFVRMVPPDQQAGDMAEAQTVFRRKHGPQGPDDDGDDPNPPEIILHLNHHSAVWKVSGMQVAAAQAQLPAAAARSASASASPSSCASPCSSARTSSSSARAIASSFAHRVAAAFSAAAATPASTDGQATKTTSPLLIFHSAMLSNGPKMAPSMQIASYVDPEMVKGTLPQNWCSKAQFDAMMKETAERACFTYNLGTHNRDIFLRSNGAFFEKLKRRYRSMHIELSTVEEGSVLKVTCHKTLVGLIKERVERRIKELQQEEVYLPVPQGAKIGNFIGPKGAEIQKLQQELGDLLRNALGEEDYENRKLKSWIFVEGRTADGSWSDKANPKERVRILLKGRVKALMAVIVGRVRSALIEKCELNGTSDPLIWLDNAPNSIAGVSSAKMLKSPRLMFLSQRQKPPPPTDADSAKLHVAHAAVWDAGCSVYGGFVRDWVIRGESANDIDVNTGDYDATQRAMQQALQPYGITMQTSQPWGETKAYRRLTFVWQGSSLEVDLVDPSKVPHTPPGVDCDVGNLKIDSRGGLQLKVPELVSLEKSIKHALSKKFVCFYEPSSDMAKRRIQKYMQRGWVIKSPVPKGVGGTPQQIQTKQKYSEAFWQR